LRSASSLRRSRFVGRGPWRPSLSAPGGVVKITNVNVPAGTELRGYAVTKLGKHSYGFDVIEKVDPRGRKYYWIGGNEYQHEDVPGSDCNAVLREGLASVTPLQLDLTDEPTRRLVREWALDGFARRVE
jgi:5'-nucleotidase